MDEQTIEKLFLEGYEGYADKIFRHCFFRLRDREKAKEVSQEVFTKVWMYMRKGNEVEHMGAFLYKVANNLIIDTVRARRDTISLDAMLDIELEPQADRKDPMFSADARRILSFVDQLEEKYKEVIMMRYMEDMAVKDIARMKGVSQVNVSVRIHRGLSKLKALMEPTQDNMDGME
ncbi:MAG: hypothetical protein COV07_04595 [Candidatus Vogelbacteria bacterium CG10_big_fil_rev_8_21_14_0_10_45_14]|uniref:RNA polymerase subunit sigma-24 n=1 Tax=Candidatus Vogelbacteria bacterium CG10_big_fil_rev_8_21_14_0_10_45_14 TaxID=1975042 RepID=A0A2H0RIH7_9BACT|nr:MAG: hypothetical protein COV07_04595 [Candidatus Vogelbacteria bacterium CG10_big_fil_rev_8_21_14_0_10_45_14]